MSSESVIKPESPEKKIFSMEHDSEDFPEGGFGWCVVAGAWVAMSSAFGMLNSFAVYQTYYQTLLYPHEGAFKLSLIGSLQGFCILIMAVPSSSMLESLGATKSLAIGTLVQIFLFMMMLLTNLVWQLFLTQGLLFGFGSGIVYLTAFAVVVQWFKTKKALAVGICSTGSSVGGVFWPIAVRRLINEVGFSWTNRILGFIYMPMAVVMVLTLRQRVPFGHGEKKQWKVARLTNKIQFLKNKLFLVLLLSFTIENLGLYPGLFYIDVNGERLQKKLGHALVKNDYLVSILNSTSFLGRLLPGILADRLGRLNVLIPLLALTGILPFAMWIPAQSSERVLIAYAALWGFCSGAEVSLFPVVIPQMFGLKDNHTRLALFFAIGAIGGLFGPMICGAFIPVESNSNGTEGFAKVAIFVGATLLGGAAILAWVRLHVNPRLTAVL